MSSCYNHKKCLVMDKESERIKADYITCLEIALTWIPSCFSGSVAIVLDLLINTILYEKEEEGASQCNAEPFVNDLQMCNTVRSRPDVLFVCNISVVSVAREAAPPTCIHAHWPGGTPWFSFLISSSPIQEEIEKEQVLYIRSLSLSIHLCSNERVQHTGFA